MKQLDNSFWQYSVKRYANSIIAEICLFFQNQYGANINLLLLADWLGDQKIIVSSQDWQLIEAHVRHWHTSIVTPLRHVRQELKNLINDQPVLSLRENINVQELLAEKIEQAILYGYISEKKYHPSNEDSNTCKQHNIMHYLQLYVPIDDLYYHSKEKVNAFLIRP